MRVAEHGRHQESKRDNFSMIHHICTCMCRSSGDARVVPGYDWVAGLLDTTGPSVSQFSTTWLQELKEFRQVNHSECYMPQEQ